MTLLDYQQQALGSSRTDRDGIARIAVPRPAFLATVRHGGQTGYLRLDGGSALPMAHFDVAGTRSPRGLKGFLYGERGIWRPGDTMHLTFILHDPTKRLAADHPVRFDLLDPRGQLVRTVTRTQSTDGFYAFEVATSPDAPTGNYTGRVSVGGATFDKTLKVETVMPNRLKIAMDFGTDELRAKSRISGVLSAAWLHGAPARSLKADVELALSPARTSFKRFEEYVFDDPTRKYETERQKIFEGSLDPRARPASTPRSRRRRSRRASCGPTSRPASSSRAGPSASTASASRTPPTSATWACAPRRATRRAGCSSPTRSTGSTWPWWTPTGRRAATARWR